MNVSVHAIIGFSFPLFNPIFSPQLRTLYLHWSIFMHNPNSISHWASTPFRGQLQALEEDVQLMKKLHEKTSMKWRYTPRYGPDRRSRSRIKCLALNVTQYFS